ncbi:MAG: hypothetical protein COT45_00290 [bacterium (Candidatus Stahlbacteria) CG08_land_8_20_14_0_20_40_26]|nr:MAG: hypothetical protein COX49_05730 [bacterium (Candidatus Stahlbacteria) CG23_combo_of_CG06-09_8_20_14_all_40_9]PIS26808.1 MAG: hypothetical protein COT45_00290 [bacterium (Candidatus Stahlbacteria) CG08_land_8_20_14_0_20_40_26]
MTSILIIILLIGTEFKENIPYRKGDTRAEVEIKLSGCKLAIKKGNENSILSTYISYDKERISPNMEYKREKGVCRIRLSSEQKNNSIFGKDSAVVYLAPHIPLSLRIYTSSESRIDLSSIKVGKLHLVLGIGNTFLSIDESNPITCEEIRIYGNIARLNTEGLGYLNFERFYFDLNAGMATLDMTGVYNGRSDAEIKMGIATLTLILPPETGIRLKTKGVLYTSAEGLIRKDNWYTSKNFGRTDGELLMHIYGGLGTLKIMYKK